MDTSDDEWSYCDDDDVECYCNEEDGEAWEDPFEILANEAFAKYLDLPLEFYLVGGAVRDCMMNISKTNSDYDFVVVNSSPAQMIELGFEQVGSSFPIFLHPVTRDEFALARNKVNGKISWEDGTLQSDLKLRDFKANSVAMDKTGKIIHFFEDDFLNNFDSIDNVVPTYPESLEDDPLRAMRACRIQAYDRTKLEFGDEYINHKFLENAKKIPKERILKELRKVASGGIKKTNLFLFRYQNFTKSLRSVNIDLYGIKYNFRHLHSSQMHVPSDFILGSMLAYNIFPVLSNDKNVVKVANIIKMIRMIEGVFSLEMVTDQVVYDIMCKVSETRGCRDIISDYTDIMFSDEYDNNIEENNQKIILLNSVISAFDNTKFNLDDSIDLNTRVKKFKQDKEDNVKNALNAFFVIKKLEN